MKEFTGKGHLGLYVKYQRCKVEEEDKGITYTILSDTEQTGFIGITVIEWK